MDTSKSNRQIFFLILFFLILINAIHVLVIYTSLLFLKVFTQHQIFITVAHYFGLKAISNLLKINQFIKWRFFFHLSLELIVVPNHRFFIHKLFLDYQFIVSILNCCCLLNPQVKNYFQIFIYSKLIILVTFTNIH